jgi:error-prone DNA polymerase
MQFVTFEDETSLFETVLFPAVYSRFYHMPGSDRAAFHLTGKVVEEFGAITLEVKKIE